MGDRRTTITIAANDSFSAVMDRYNRAMNESAQTTQKATEAAQENETALQGLTGVLGTLGLAFGASQVVQFVGKMNALGVQVNANQRLFNALTHDLGDGAKLMTQFRQATGGVVDDLSLMSGANQLLRLNVTQTADQTAHLLENIVKLKAPTDDMTTAISNFSLMLSNQSIARLDSFGLSAAEARDRMAELKQEGLDTADAFRQAVFEQMDQQVARLGDAATVSETNLAKLQVRWDNFMQDIAAGVNRGAEGAAGTLNDILATGEQRADAAQRLRDQLERMFGPAQSAIFTLGSPMSGYTTEQVNQANRALDFQKSLAQGWQSAETALHGYYDLFSHAFTGKIETFQQGIMRQPIETAMIQMQQDLSQLNELWGMGAGVTGSGLPAFLDPQQYDRINQMLNRVQQNAATIKYEFKDLLSDQDISIIDRMANGAKDLASQAKAAADAFEKMSLTDIFGTSGGGVLGDITDQFTKFAKAQGWTDQQIAPYVEQFNMASGRETPMSQTFQQQVLPQMLAMTPDVAVKFAQNWSQAMSDALTHNINPNDLIAFGPNTFGGVFGPTQRQIDVKPGDNLYSLAQRYGGSYQDYRPLLNAQGILPVGRQDLPGGAGQIMPGFDPSSYLQSIMDSLNTSAGAGFGTGGQGFDGLRDATDESANNVQRMSMYGADLMTAIEATVANLKHINDEKYTVHLDVQAPDWFKALIGGAGIDFGSLLGKTVANNGGRVPGASNQIPRGGPVISRD